MNEIMPLNKALYILSMCHTRDDDLTGFVVEYPPMLSPAGEFSRAEYFEAWRSVRHNIGFQADPAEAKAVETIERAKRAFDTLTRAIEAEGYSVFVDPDGNYSIELKDAETTPLMEMGEAIREHGLPEIDRSPSPFWKNHVAGEQDHD